MLTFSSFYQHSGGACSWNPSSWKTRTLHILHSQYHGCWWLGYGRSQGISSHGFDLVILECSSFSIRKVKDTVCYCADELLTHWDWVTHICLCNLTIISSDNGLSPGRRQTIIWTNASVLLIGPLGTNFSEISIEMQTFSFKKMCLKVSSARWRPFYLGLNVINRSTSHELCLMFAFCCSSNLLLEFADILQDYFSGTGAIVWLPLCQWSNLEENG